jgi:mitofusin
MSLPKRTLTMSFADDPVNSQEIVMTELDANNASACGTGSHIIKRKTLHRSLTFAPNGNTLTRDADLLGSRATAVLEDMTDFSILRLDLSLGHGHNVASRAGTIMSSLERNSISRLLSSRIESSLSHLKNIQERIMSTRSRVLVTGDLNAGKSTFVNALLRRGGRDDDGWPSGVMPVDQQPLTGRFVEVFGEENETAQVPEQVHVVKGIEADYDLEDEATFEKKAVSDLPDLVAEQAANAPPLKVYLRSPSTDLANPSILHNGILDISLIDAPGLNRDIIPTTSTFTRSPTIDVIIFVVSAFNHFTLSAKEFILSAGQEKARMFIVVNRFDEVRDKEKCKRIVLEQIKQLSPKTWAEREDLVHFVDSATVALRQSEACNNNTITTAAVGQEQELDLAFHHLESSLRSFVLINRAKSKLGPAENYLCHLLADVELLSSANAVVAEETRDKAIQDQNRVKPSLQVMLKNRSSLEEALDKEEETIGQEIDTRVGRDLKLALSAIGIGRTAPDCGISLPPYPGFMGIWNYAAMVRTALLTSFEVKIAQLEEQTRTHTASSIHAISIIGDRYLPSDAERTVRIFNPKALFPSAQSELNSRTRRISQSRSSSVGLGLLARSDLTNASPSDIFDLNHYILAAKTMLAGGSHSPEGHDGELTLLRGLSLAAGAFTIFGGKAIGLRGALDSMVALTDVVGHRAARQWAAPVVGVLIVSMSIYVIQDLPNAIPRNVGRQLRQALQAASDSYSEQTGAVDYVEYQSTRMQREARKVIRLASWDLRERFRAALDKKSMILRESEEEEKRAIKAMQNFAALQTRSNEIKSAMGKSVFI